MGTALNQTMKTIDAVSFELKQCFFAFELFYLSMSKLRVHEMHMNPSFTGQTLRLLKNSFCFYYQSVKSQKCSLQPLLWGSAAASAGGGAFAIKPELRGMAVEEVLLRLQNSLHLNKSIIPFPCFKNVSQVMWLFPQTVFLFCLSATLPNHLEPSISIECLHKCWGEQDTLAIPPSLCP